MWYNGIWDLVNSFSCMCMGVGVYVYGGGRGCGRMEF